MGLEGRIDRLEAEEAELELRPRAVELAAKLGLEVTELMDYARRIHARLQLLERTHPLPVVDGMVDIAPHLRILAEEEGLDPDMVLEEARRVAEGMGHQNIGE